MHTLFFVGFNPFKLFCIVSQGCLQLKDVERALEEKSILPVLSVEGDKKSELYKVVQRLVRVSSGLIIPHFFLCSICKSVLNINTSTHYPALGRHYSKCVKTARGVNFTSNKDFFFKC